MWNIYTMIERLLMLLDGRFYNIISLKFMGDACSESTYDLYAKKYKETRLSYYKTSPVYFCNHHNLLNYYDILSSKLVESWKNIEEELDIVHPVFLYNVADTGVTCDVKCAYLIECLEALAEIANLKSVKGKMLLKDCVRNVISSYGIDIFHEEYKINEEAFLQILVNTRHRLMHIKRKQSIGKFLSGKESILFSVKIYYLYRVVVLSLLGIDYSKYEENLQNSIKYWNEWQNVLHDFLKRIK